jgi:hypothetical protein
MNDKQKVRWDLLVRDCKDSYYQSINVGGKFLRSIIVLVDEMLKTHKYTEVDLQEFAEWTSEGNWAYIKESRLWHKFDCVGRNAKVFTSSDLMIQWEIETGRREK